MNQKEVKGESKNIEKPIRYKKDHVEKTVDVIKLGIARKTIFICVYILLPITLVLFGYFILRNLAINSMTTMKIKNFSYEMLNSENTVNNVVTPFFTSFFLILSFSFSYIILLVIKRKYFSSPNYIVFAQKVLRWAEIIILFIGLISMVYSNVDKIPYTETESYKKYIKDKNNLAEIQYSLKDSDGNDIKINYEGSPTFVSEGLNSHDTKLGYRVMMWFSQFFKSFTQYFNVLVTIVGGIIFPLKNYKKDDKTS